MGQTITQISHQNKSIAVLDYTCPEREELIKRTEEVKAWMITQPPKSVLTLSDFSGQKFNKDVVDVFKDLALHNKPFVKAGALIGVEGLQKIAYNTIMKFSGRNMPAFGSREEALDWLVRQ